MKMEILKIPHMEKEEYDKLIAENHISRIAFMGNDYPYVAPFLYVFDGHNLYFLSTKYGKKIRYVKRNPNVAVEIERFTPDMSSYTFVTLLGRLAEVSNDSEGMRIRKEFVDLIKTRNLSSNIIAALGHSPGEPLESVVNESRSLIWKLEAVKDIVALKNA